MSDQSGERSRSPVVEYIYVVPDQTQLVELINQDNPEHRLLDEILRATFCVYDVIPASALDVGDPADDVEVRLDHVDDGKVKDKEVRACGDEEVMVKAQCNGVVVTHDEGDLDISDVFDRLNSKLDEMTVATRRMHSELAALSRDIQTADRLTTRLLRETRRCLADVRATRFLDDLLHMLRDRLEYITLRKWPFLAANVHDYWGDTSELNLVV